MVPTKMRNSQYTYPDGKKEDESPTLACTTSLSMGLMKHRPPIHAWKLTLGHSWKATIGPIYWLLFLSNYLHPLPSPRASECLPFKLSSMNLFLRFCLFKKSSQTYTNFFGWGRGAFDNTLMDPWWHIVDKSSLNTVCGPYVVDPLTSLTSLIQHPRYYDTCLQHQTF